jgi:hypothetical protein
LKKVFFFVIYKEIISWKKNMKNIFKRLIITFLVFCGSLWFVLAWNWLIAENWDLLNLTKWNELIVELQSKIGLSDLKSGTNINLTYSGSEVTVNSLWWWGSSTPFITTSTLINMSPSQTQNITLDWINFTPSSTLLIPGFDGTVNTTTPISPTQIQANVTSWTNEVTYDLVVSNGWVLNTLWAWNGNWLYNVWPIIWAGPAGTYTETFETNTLGNWTAVTGLTANVSFAPITWGTPSGSTWPNNASAGSYYIYTEASNPNFPNRTFAVETDNFRNAQNISFDYHMFGVDMWTLIVQTYYWGAWTDTYTIAGQQQTVQADAWLNTWNIDLTSYNVEKIRFFYTSWANYTWDLSIDNIIINSI